MKAREGHASYCSKRSSQEATEASGEANSAGLQGCWKGNTISQAEPQGFGHTHGNAGIDLGGLHAKFGKICTIALAILKAGKKP